LTLNERVLSMLADSAMILVAARHFLFWKRGDPEARTVAANNGWPITAEPKAAGSTLAARRRAG
jgi:hypothetical protein